MRKMQPWGWACLVAASLSLSSGWLRADTGPTVSMHAVVKDSAVRLELKANGPFEYSSDRPAANLFVVNITGVSLGQPVGAKVLDSDLVASYRLLEFPMAPKPYVRLEVLLRTPLEPQVERENAEQLAIVVSRPLMPVSAPANKPTEPAAISAPTRAIAPLAVSAAKLEGSSATPIRPSGAAIQQIQLVQIGTQTEVNVRGAGHLDYHLLRLTNPDRLVLDFSGAILRTAQKTYASNLDPVREIRAAQFAPSVARVVIDLRESARFTVSASSSAVTVAFAPGTDTGSSAKPASDPVPPSVVTTKKIGPSLPAAVPAPPARKQFKTIQPTAAPAIARNETAGALPKNLTQPSAALAAPAPAATLVPTNSLSSSISPISQASTSFTSAGPNVSSANAAFSTPTTAPMSTGVTGVPAVSTPPAAKPLDGPGVPAAAVPVATSSAPPAGKYSGEPISVNLKEVDLRDFFRLIHEISGLNVVVDPNVKGNLTIVLDDVPWDQALDIVLHNNDLDKQLDGNVLRVATKETLKKEAEQTRDLAKAQAEAADVVTTTRVLSYAKAEDLVTTMKKFLSSRGDVLADPRSNTLIIRDIPSVIPVMDNLIRQLDRKSQQVEIEARVVAANRSFSREIGSQFAFATSAVNGKNVFGGASAVGTSPVTRVGGPIPPLVINNGTGGSSGTTSSQLPLVTNLGASTPTSGITYLFTSPNFFLDYIITAAESKGVGKLLSKPRVATQNNTKAIVKQGTKIPIQTIINNTISVQYVDAVLELEVTPQITAEGTVFMDVHVENTQIDPSIPRVLGIPALDTEAADSKILINDGGTVVVGGIIISSQRTDIQQVPIVGTIPLIGNLFRHTTVNTSSQELLFFLTPRILPS